MRLLCLILIVIGSASLAACGSDDDGDAGGAATTAATTAAETTETTVDGECHKVEAPDPKPDGGQQAPTADLDPAKTYRLIVETNCGTFTIELDQKSAPKTAASLVSLAESGFYDGTTFHRVVPGFVIQGGDPTGTGGGGPGYKTVDVPPAGVAYTRGVVAMAKAQAEALGTSGSQFFVVTAPDAGLPPEYAVVGRVTQGMETVEAIEALGAGDGPPSMPVVMERVTVQES
jgi:peptidyl-prolyl cis-trans isomerase B (cyclophilin B)